ncbi:hypothetical protein AB0J63_20080 [Streptosporangium canum]|uniref:hypothetical protein n=1 Tax=Streptosporangium canum TaxID=324952 RepID=UPI0034177862
MGTALKVAIRRAVDPVLGYGFGVNPRLRAASQTARLDLASASGVGHCRMNTSHQAPPGRFHEIDQALTREIHDLTRHRPGGGL